MVRAGPPATDKHVCLATVLFASSKYTPAGEVPKTKQTDRKCMGWYLVGLTCVTTPIKLFEYKKKKKATGGYSG